MELSWQDACLAIAGLIGCTVAIVHGVLIQRVMVQPLRAHLSTHAVIGSVSARLLAPLLHFSTFSRLLGGAALIAVAFWRSNEARLITAFWSAASTSLRAWRTSGPLGGAIPAGF